MIESIYVALWALAGVLFIFHTIFKKGGVMSSSMMLALFIGLYYPSTNVLMRTEAGIVTSSNPIAQWLALFGAIISFIIVLFALFGMWGTTDEEDQMDSDTIVTDSPKAIRDITGRL